MATTKRTSPPKLADDLNVAAITGPEVKKKPADTKPSVAGDTPKKASRSRKPTPEIPSSPPAAAPATPVMTEKAAEAAAETAKKAAPLPEPKSKAKPAGEKARAKSAPAKKAQAGAKLARPDQAEIDRMIAEAAYYLAEKRNFAPGFEEEDWAAARAEVEARLSGGNGP